MTKHESEKDVSDKDMSISSHDARDESRYLEAIEKIHALASKTNVSAAILANIKEECEKVLRPTE